MNCVLIKVLLCRDGLEECDDSHVYKCGHTVLVTFLFHHVILSFYVAFVQRTFCTVLLPCHFSTIIQLHHWLNFFCFRWSCKIQLPYTCRRLLNLDFVSLFYCSSCFCESWAATEVMISFSQLLFMTLNMLCLIFHSKLCTYVHAVVMCLFIFDVHLVSICFCSMFPCRQVIERINAVLCFNNSWL